MGKIVWNLIETTIENIGYGLSYEGFARMRRQQSFLFVCFLFVHLVHYVTDARGS
jgi:hypothetical protein